MLKHPLTRWRKSRILKPSSAAPVERLEPRTLMTAVTSVLVNGGDAGAAGQRSVIDTIAVRFDANVGASVNPADLRLWNATTRQFVDTAGAKTSYDAGNNTATWTFPAAARRPMLPEGNYRATVLSMTVYDTAGKPLDGDRDGVGGDEYTFTFHRLFGDADGDRDVDARDALRARLARRSASATERAAFDSDGDGALSARDFLALRRNLRKKLQVPAGNRPPAAPVINEPTTDGQLIDAQDLHMQIEQAFVDPDQAPDPQGLTRSGTDWEVWTRGSVPERVFRVLNSTQFDSKVHVHFGDGVFEGSLAGRRALLPDTDYLLRVRHRDSSGDPGTADSNWDVRLFRTRTEDLPTAAGWAAKQAGYEVQEIPFVFGAGEPGWSLPVNIAFVPQSVARTGPKDPLFYVTELYGKVRVVTHDYTVYTYASGLLNYDPSGPFGGSGENGVTGLAVDPTTGDVFATMLYDDLTDTSGNTFPKVTRFTSTDGGLHAVDTSSSQAGTQGVDILKMPGESMRQSHIISNLTFGPDDKLYVHVGDGFDATRGQEDNSFRGKVLRINRNGSPATDNPRYSSADVGNDGKPDPTDYWFAEGLRNPFGGAWRDANPAAGTPAQHFMVENGPSLDRFTMLVRNRNYLYDGSNASMRNFNIAWSPLATGAFENGERDWEPSPAPVNITFAQASAFGGSGFPSDKLGHAFVTLSGATHASGTSSKAKLIEEWVLNPDGTRYVPKAGEPANPRDLVKYQGAGYSTAAAIAAGPGGLYFSTLYPDTNADPTAPGAKILRVVYTGTAAAAGTPGAGSAEPASGPTTAPAAAPVSPAAFSQVGVPRGAGEAAVATATAARPAVPVWVGRLFADAGASNGGVRARDRGGVRSLLDGRG